jgi:lipid-A-disaccharide synthase-like uncharacterized protein
MLEKKLVVPYSATGISIVARFIFMYLLYTKKSTNDLSLLFCLLNIISSSLWIDYSLMVFDRPIMIRGSSDLVLFTISAAYIIYNKRQLYLLEKVSPFSSKDNLQINP